MPTVPRVCVCVCCDPFLLPCSDVKGQLIKENEELKQQRDELEVRINALRSQYEGRLSRQEKELRELRDLREQQERHVEQRDEPAEQGPSKVVFTKRSSCSCRSKMEHCGFHWTSSGAPLIGHFFPSQKCSVLISVLCSQTQEQQRTTEQRQISLKSTPVAERGRCVIRWTD